MPKQSAGLLMYRRRGGVLEVFLVHPGGPFYAAKDEGVWSIPKGEFSAGEDPLTAALREFTEETGFEAEGPFRALTPVQQRSGKVVHAWAVEGDVDAGAIRSNTFAMEWPPKSGRQKDFPEADRAGWFTAPEAKGKLLPAQIPLLEELLHLLDEPEG